MDIINSSEQLFHCILICNWLLNNLLVNVETIIANVFKLATTTAYSHPTVRTVEFECHCN